MNFTLAHHFARGLLKWVPLSHRESVLDALELASRLWVAGSPLVDACQTPSLTLIRRLDLADEVAVDAGLGVEVRALLRLLVINRQLGHLSVIRNVFRQMNNQERGLVEAIFTSAVPLKSEQRSLLIEALERRLQKEVVPVFIQDPAVLAGVKVKAGDLVVDGTLLAQLDRLGEALRSMPYR